MKYPSKIYYEYDAVVGVYLGPIENTIDPMATKYAGRAVYAGLPNATDVPPPEQEGKTAVFGEHGWELVADYRNQTAYRTADKSSLEITDLGELPAGYTLLQPSEFDSWTSNEWQTDIAAELQHTQPQLYMAIDEAAGRARARYITTAPGQEITYLLKLREAEKYQAALSPTLDGFPLLSAESTELNIVPDDLVLQWLNQANMWQVTAAKIEPTRIKAKLQIQTAINKSEADAIALSAITKLDAI